MVSKGINKKPHTGIACGFCFLKDENLGGSYFSADKFCDNFWSVFYLRVGTSDNSGWKRLP